jgi:hypothetical protein
MASTKAARRRTATRRRAKPRDGGVREELGGGLGQVEPEQEKWWMRSIAPWSRQDLFFVENSLQRGSSFAEIASFLGRDEDEVRQKAEDLKFKRSKAASPQPTDRSSSA